MYPLLKKKQFLQGFIWTSSKNGIQLLNLYINKKKLCHKTIPFSENDKIIKRKHNYFCVSLKSLNN